MAGPWERYGKPGVVASSPAVPKAPPGFIPGANPTVAPGYVAGQAQLAGAEANAREAAQRKTIEFQTQQAIREATAKAGIEKNSKNALDPQKLANIRAAQAQIDRLNRLFMAGPGRTKGVSSALDFLPSPSNAQFDTAGAGLGEVGLAAFRVPGVGSQSDTELRAFIDANRPRASDYDARIKEKLRNLQSRLDQTYSVYGLKRQGPVAQNAKVIDFSDLPE